VPEIPRSQGSAQLTWSRASTLVSAGVRAYSLQFDDDLNQFRLPGYSTLQFYARQRLGKGVSATAAFDNLLDYPYVVANSGYPNIGEPRMWRVGMRWDLR